MIKFNPSTVVPKAADIEASAKKAMANIDAQLSKMPAVQQSKSFFSELAPLKKPASAADNFPGIYDNPVVTFFSPRTTEAVKELSANAAIKQYGYFG